MPSHTVAERLKKSTRMLADPSKFLGLSDFIDQAEKKTRPLRSQVESEIKRILGFITGKKK